MKIVRAFSLVLGLLLAAMGLLWIGQGLGLIMWPSSSFMLAEPQWAVNGAVLATVGLALAWYGRKR